MSNIRQWLDSLELSQYVDAFEENAIEWTTLRKLDHELLKEIGVKPVGHRVAMLEAIERLSAEPAIVQEIGAVGVQHRSPSGDAERRQLTVMFCDLVSSTALSTRLDPEDLREVITAFQDRCRQAVQRYQGFIARYMGDGLLVYFGYPQAHEDDAVRAAHAGLEIVAAMAELNSDVGRSHAVVLAVRVGVATGPVVVGDIVGEGAAEEAAVVGETPNLAARLQGVAQPNQVVISGVTRELLGELFELAALGAHSLKGIPEPVTAWRVVAERDAESRFHARRASEDGTPLVGRQEELGLLLRAWDASKEGHGQVVLVTGEAGIGKSRLLEALRAADDSGEFTWASIRCSPYHVNSALYPVIEHLKRVLRWRDDDTAEVKLEKLEQGVSGYQNLQLEEAVPLFADLLSLPLSERRFAPLGVDVKQRRQLTLDALVAWIMEEAERKPLLAGWEDVHWADPSSVDLLGLFIEQVPTVPMLVVATFRPDFAPPWVHRSHVTPITLNRLELPEVRAIVTNLAGSKELPETVMEHITSKADGVPLYVEELTKTVLESDILEERGERYVLNGELSEMHIPATLQDSLMARLDRLPAVREVAQLGAVLGRQFAYEMLLALTSVEEPALQQGLGQLVEAELLYQRGRPPRAKYMFKHALIQDAAYRSLLNHTRRQYHKQVVELLQTRFPETIEAHPELAAHHYTEAGLKEQAIEYWKNAGRIASERSATREAIAHVRKALELLETCPASRERARQELTLQSMLGSALVAIRGYGAAEVVQAYSRARELCHEAEATEALFPVLFGLWLFYIGRADHHTARELAQEVDGLARAAGDEALLLYSRTSLGVSALYLGEFEQARSHLEQGIALYDRQRHAGLAVRFGGLDAGVTLGALNGWALWMLGYADQALERGDEALVLARDLPHIYTRARSLNWDSQLHQFRREHRIVAERADETVELAAEHGFALVQAQTPVMRGWAIAADGRSEEGVAEMRRGLAECEATGADLFRTYFLGLLAEQYDALNEPEQGLQALADALTLVEQTGERFYLAELRRLKGDLLLARSADAAVDAERCYRDALDVARGQGAKSLELRAATSLARLRLQQGESAAARDALAGVYDWFTEGFDTPDLKDAKSLLDELA